MPSPATKLQLPQPKALPTHEQWKQTRLRAVRKTLEGDGKHRRTRNRETWNWTNSWQVTLARLQEEAYFLSLERAFEAADRVHRRWRPKVDMGLLVYTALAAMLVLGAQRGWQGLLEYQADLRTANIARIQRTAKSTTQVRTDGRGVLAEIAGPTPRDVLIAFCTRTAYEPIALTASHPPRAGVRLGLVQHGTDPDSRYSIEIRRRAGANDWVVGDGSRPLRAGPAPELPPGTPTIPVDWGR